MVGQVETLRQSFELNVAPEVKDATETDVQIQVIAALAGIPRNERSIDHRPACRALDGRDAGRNVQGKRRVCLEHRAHLKTVCQMLDQRCGDLTR